MSEEIRRVITIEDKASGALENLVDTASEAAEELNKVDVNIKSFDKTSKSFTNGLDDIAEGLDQIVPGTKQVTEGFTKVKTALKALVANPVILGITAVVTVIYGLVQAIKSNENAMASLKNAFKAFEPVLDVFNDLIEATADFIADVVKQLGVWITKFTDFIGLTSDAKRAQKELAEQSKITNEMISNGLVSGVDNYRQLSESLITLRFNYGKLANVINKQNFNETLKKFAEDNKSVIEQLANSSGTFRSLFENVKSTSDFVVAMSNVSESLETINTELAKSSDVDGVRVEQQNALIKGMKQLSELRAKDAAEADRLVIAMYDAKIMMEEINTEWNKDLNPDNNAYYNLFTAASLNATEFEKKAKETRETVIDSIKDIMKAAYAAVGATSEFDDEWSKFFEKFNNNIPMGEIVDSASENLREWLNDYIFHSAGLIASGFELDVDNIFQGFDNTPVLIIHPDLRIDNDALEEALSQINDNTDFSNLDTNLTAAFDTSYYEKMLNISSAQLENLHEYTVEYYDKMREVEEWAWKTEEARLEAEGYTNSQIEKLRKEHNNRLEKINKQQVIAVANATAEGLGSLASMFDAFADLTGEESEQAFETSKKLQIASAVVTMLQGIATAVATGMQLGPIAGPIVGAVNAATVMATGIAQISKIKATKFDNASASGATISESATSTSYNPTYTANTTGASDIDALQGAVASGTSSGASAVKVYVTESDITEAQNAKKVKVTESTF